MERCYREMVKRVGRGWKNETCYREPFPHLLLSAMSFAYSKKIDTRAATVLYF